MHANFPKASGTIVFDDCASTRDDVLQKDTVTFKNLSKVQSETAGLRFLMRLP